MASWPACCASALPLILLAIVTLHAATGLRAVRSVPFLQLSNRGSFRCMRKGRHACVNTARGAQIICLRMQSAGGENGGGDVNARIEKVMSSRLVSGSAGKQNMPMSRSEERAYQRIGEELMEAVRGGNANIVKQLCLEKQADPSFADDFGFSCLHLAAKRGYQDVVQVLVDMGADINQEGEGGTIPLHMAAQCGNLLLVQYMVGLGADVDLKDASGSTPLRLAQTYGHRKVEDYLRERVDTGSGRWAKEDEENREQTIYDDSTFPWDSFLKENKDKIVVDMEEEDEYGQDEGEIPQELRDAMKRVEDQASYMQPPGSGGVIDVSGEQVSARTIENRESKLRANQPPPTVDMSDELKREMDGLLGVSGLAEPTRPGTADDKAGGPRPSGEERSNVGGAESNTELDKAEEEMILQSAVETLLREIPGAQRVDMSQADRFQAAIKNEAAKKRKASEQGRQKESERDDPMKKAQLLMDLSEMLKQESKEEGLDLVSITRIGDDESKRPQTSSPPPSSAPTSSPGKKKASPQKKTQKKASSPPTPSTPPSPSPAPALSDDDAREAGGGGREDSKDRQSPSKAAASPLKFGPEPPAAKKTKTTADKAFAYTREDQLKGIPPPPGWEPPRPLRPEEAMKLIAGDDWIPASERRKAARAAAAAAGGRAKPEEEDEWNDGELREDGAIDISTYGLEESDEDDDPRNWKTATEAL